MFLQSSTLLLLCLSSCLDMVHATLGFAVCLQGVGLTDNGHWKGLTTVLVSAFTLSSQLLLIQRPKINAEKLPPTYGTQSFLKVQPMKVISAWQTLQETPYTELQQTGSFH